MSLITLAIILTIIVTVCLLPFLAIGYVTAKFGKHEDSDI